MQAWDAAGRQVSLLNDDAYTSRPSYPMPRRHPSLNDQAPALIYAPELIRSDSYDSNASYDTVSPLTPNVYDYPARPCYDEYFHDKQPILKRSAYAVPRRASSHDDESLNGSQEKPGKRYPCRYRGSHGCEKTFTTSGHASRHSKIHTAEKAVQCTFRGCHKKFTRADNMKQHLETHFKEKSRASSSSKSKGSSSMSSSNRGSMSKSSSSARGNRASGDVHMWDAESYDTDYVPVPSPSGAWDMRGLNAPLLGPVGAVRASSGLDALAAIACREGP
ncbi:hypothetical protein GGR50DRAFT_27490 [Xylaria sp. CBS 124048]|nr:hypothetical protein GGR50DRAFT_27490 [Xylaria sp. CBS 124048]